MNKLAALFLTISFAIVPAGAQKGSSHSKEVGPQPPMVDPGGPGKPPSDAIALFDGKGLSNWVMSDGRPPEWTVQDGVLISKTGTGDLHSRLKFRSAQIHVEFNVPLMPEQNGQARGNSGVMLHDRTNEIQILDSYQNPTYADGVCGALYAVAVPQVNACRRPGEWQTYDIIYHAPQCGSGGAVRTPGRLTLLRNGVLVLDSVPDAPRGGCLEEGPLILQDHNGFAGRPVPPGAKMKAPVTPMRFRNIWLRRLAD